MDKMGIWQINESSEEKFIFQLQRRTFIGQSLIAVEQFLHIML